MKRLHHPEKDKIKRKIYELLGKIEDRDNFNLLLFYLLKLLNIYLEEAKNRELRDWEVAFYNKVRDIRNKIAHNEKISIEEIKFIVKNLKML